MVSRLKRAGTAAGRPGGVVGSARRVPDLEKEMDDFDCAGRDRGHGVRGNRLWCLVHRYPDDLDNVITTGIMELGVSGGPLVVNDLNPGQDISRQVTSAPKIPAITILKFLGN